jgi:site-specific DNA-methyltransferase (adenine-specific)
VRDVKAEIAKRPVPPKALPMPAAPQVIPDGVRLLVGDARAMALDDASVDLIVTSPRYGLEVAYDASDDGAEDWPAFMGAWLAEASRVAKVGGRLALNVPLDTSKGGFRPTYHQALVEALAVGWTYRATIIWAEGNVSDLRGRGSPDSAAAIHFIAPVEMIALFSKGDWKREDLGGDLTHEEWLAWTNGLWTFPGESRPWEGFPAAFPEELPRRLIKLLSFPGDTVLDPFAGSGTTIVAAHKLGCRAIGVDCSEAYVGSTRRQLAGGGR